MLGMMQCLVRSACCGCLLLLLLASAAYADCASGDCINGEGVYNFDKGIVYKGQFKDGKPEGKGVMTWPQGSKYEGDFKNGMRDGVGVYTRQNGERYEGQFKNDKCHGKGKLTYESGETYDGVWDSNFKHGKAEYTTPDGHHFTGTYQRGRRTGEGVYVWPDGTSYKGLFDDDKPNGKGVMRWKGGSSYEGEFKDGKPEGQGAFYAVEGGRHRGQMERGQAGVGQDVSKRERYSRIREIAQERKEKIGICMKTPWKTSADAYGLARGLGQGNLFIECFRGPVALGPADIHSAQRARTPQPSARAAGQAGCTSTQWIRVSGRPLGKLEDAPLDSTEYPDAGANVREWRRDYDRDVKIPQDLAVELARTASVAETAWEQARPADDWKGFKPHLQRMLELKREKAEALGYESKPTTRFWTVMSPAKQQPRWSPCSRNCVRPLRDCSNVLSAADTRPGDVRGQRDF